MTARYPDSGTGFPRSPTLETAAITLDTAENPACDETLEAFLEQVQARALAMARYATRSTDEALDLVQEAMCAFVRAYRSKPADERRPLFYRCLNNRILDWQRKRARRGRWLIGLRAGDDRHADGPDPDAVTPASLAPEHAADADAFARALERALTELPTRQRQVFLLRAWEGLDTAETAVALGISAGSVKTHHFRALAALRSALEAYHE